MTYDDFDVYSSPSRKPLKTIRHKNTTTTTTENKIRQRKDKTKHRLTARSRIYKNRQSDLLEHYWNIKPLRAHAQSKSINLINPSMTDISKPRYNEVNKLIIPAEPYESEIIFTSPNSTIQKPKHKVYGKAADQSRTSPLHHHQSLARAQETRDMYPSEKEQKNRGVTDPIPVIVIQPKDEDQIAPLIKSNISQDSSNPSTMTNGNSSFEEVNGHFPAEPVRGHSPAEMVNGYFSPVERNDHYTSDAVNGHSRSSEKGHSPSSEKDHSPATAKNDSPVISKEEVIKIILSPEAAFNGTGQPEWEEVTSKRNNGATPLDLLMKKEKLNHTPFTKETDSNSDDMTLGVDDIPTKHSLEKTEHSQKEPASLFTDKSEKAMDMLKYASLDDTNAKPHARNTIAYPVTTDLWGEDTDATNKGEFLIISYFLFPWQERNKTLSF